MLKKLKQFHKLSSPFKRFKITIPTVPKEKKERKKKEIHSPESLPKITLSQLPQIHDIMGGNTQCIGCGSIFQMEDENTPGFIHEKALESYGKRQETALKVKETLKQQSELLKRRVTFFFRF
jgi:hypothetical protein